MEVCTMKWWHLSQNKIENKYYSKDRGVNSYFYLF